MTININTTSLEELTTGLCFRIILLVLAFRAAADHAVPHLLENRQRCQHRECEQQHALYRLHISARG